VTSLRLALAALTLTVTLASPALAAEGTLVPFSGQTKIPVWRSAQAQDDGQALLRAKADGTLWLHLLSCVAEPGTRAILGGPDPGLYRRGVIVLDGQAKGCRGVVSKENFSEQATAAAPQKRYPPPDCRKPTDQWTGEKCVRAK
jgi:hypothetical protein